MTITLQSHPVPSERGLNVIWIDMSILEATQGVKFSSVLGYEAYRAATLVSMLYHIYNLKVSKNKMSQ